MSTEDNKAFVHRFIEEIFNQKKTAALAAYIAPTFVFHASGTALRPTIAELQREHAQMFAGLPDLHYAIEDMIAEGDKVVLRLTVSGTHAGAFWGYPPTGQHVTMTAIHIVRLADGKVAEDWSEADALGMREQLAAQAQPQ